MANWNEPVTTTLYTDAIAEFKNRDLSSLLMGEGTTETNLPTAAKRYNTSTNKFERYNGTTWANFGFHTTIDNHIADTSIHTPPPTGAGALWFTNSAPTGWLICDGSAISRTTYAALLAIIGTTYGAGDGSTTFNLPNFKGRIPIGRNSAVAQVDTLNKQFGSLAHTHSVPGHDHTINSHTHGMKDHTHTQSDHQHFLPQHKHGIPPHYHDSRASGASIQITASGQHVHNISTRGGGGANMDFSSTYQFGRCNSPLSTTFLYGTTDFDASGGGQGAGPTHTHPNSAFSGSVGLVTGGQNGDATFESNTADYTVSGGSDKTLMANGGTTNGPNDNTTDPSGTLTTNTGGSGTSGTGDPPCLVINFIIKT